MQTIADRFPYFEVQFTKDGQIHDHTEVDQLLAFAGQGGATDLFVVSHGWNNDMGGARQFAVFGILWPSKKFADEDQIPSGAASLAAPATGEAELTTKLEELKGFFDNPAADDVLSKA